nr:hypothetical protein [Tanacetum cinerariifolium]
MIAILEKLEHNVDFHQIVDFVEASHIRCALTINPTVYVSHIRQFWPTARIKKTNEGTKILATIDGKPRTISESSIRRNLKLNDEEGISTLPDTDLFENLALMGYNILPNQKFTFQKGQFSHQWKFLIHTIMQCLSPKSTGFNEFSINIATAVVCLATNRVYNFLKMIFDGMARNVNNKGSKFLMYPRNLFTTLRVNSPSFSGRTVPLFATMLVTQGEGSGTPTEPHHTPSPEAQQSPNHDLSSSLHPTKTTETIPTETPTEIPTLRQYSRRATRIAQSKALPTTADEPASLLRDDSQGEAFPTVFGLEVGHDRENIIKASALPHDSTPRVTSLDADEGSMQQQLHELTDLRTRVLRQQTEIGTKIEAQYLEISSLKARIKLLEDKDKGSAEQSGDDAPIKGRSTKIEAQYLEISSLKARIKLLEDKDKGSAEQSGDDAPIKGRSLETGEEAGAERSIERGNNDTEEMVNVLTSMDVANILTSGVADVSVPPTAEVSTVGVPTGSGLVPTVSAIFTTYSVVTPYSRRPREISTKDKGKEKMSEAELTIGEKIDLINELKQIEDFVPMASKEEGERVKRKGLKLEQRSAKKIKTSEDVSEEDLKEMMQLVHVEEVYVEALQVKHLIIDWEIHTEGERDY